MPYRPAPTPPGATSPSIMLTIGIMPPSAVYESWNEFTAPVEVSVVAAAKVAEFDTPNRISLPSIAAPTACGTVPRPASSNTLVSAMLAIGEDAHHRDDRVALPVLPDHPAEHPGQAERDQQDAGRSPASSSTWSGSRTGARS